MLSNQSETRVQSSIAVVTEAELEELKTELLEIRDAFRMEDVDTVEEGECLPTVSLPSGKAPHGIIFLLKFDLRFLWI